MGSSSDFVTPSHHRNLENRVVGGKAADPQRFPYYTYIKKFRGDGRGNACAGTLIAPDVVMTTASCIIGGCFICETSPTIIGVDVYVNSTSFKYSIYEHNRNGIKWIAHPDFKYFPSFVESIGLIFLDAPVFDVPPVKLNKNADVPASYDPTPVTVIDHGDQLMKLVTDTVPVPSCKKMYSSSIIGDSEICVSRDGVMDGAYFGLSGGPLLLTKGSASEDVQIGMLGTGLDPYHDDSAFVLIRMSYYAEWVDSQVCLFSKNKPSTCST